jgi:adenylate cyclase
MSETRKIAAILAADVVGYSRLTGADEERTLARLRALRSDLIDPTIAVHHGRVVKRTGDGALVEFRSVVEAVRCAIEVQGGMVERNAGLPPERRIDFRIGIHLGDIVEESDGDLMGDGVNIAARLEGIAKPGGICLSEDAFRQVKARLNVAVNDLGATQLKNIADPIRVYSLEVGVAAQPASSTRSEPAVSEKTVALALPDEPSIAVLAFQNMSGDAEQEYFADGIAEDIITALSKSRWLFVIARNSSFTYKGRTVDIKQIGRELGVRYVLEGSVRKSGNRARINAQLIEAATGAHMWAERYDRDLADIFAVQDEITGSVASAIEPAMAQAERQRVSRKLPDSLDAWEAYHRGLWHVLKLEPSENDQAKPFFQRAIDLDRGFAPGYYGLAMTHIWDAAAFATRPLQVSLGAACALAQQAVNLDDSDSMAHSVMGNWFFYSGDSTGARHELDRAISINPNNAWAVALSGSLFGNNGRLSEALDALGKAMRASPHDPLTWLWMLWITNSNYFARNYQATLHAADRLIRFRPDKSQAYRWKAAALGQLGRIDEAKISLEQAIALSPTNFSLHVRARPPWIRSDDHFLMLEGLRKAGLPE